MTQIYYDHSFDGLLTAIGYTLKNRIYMPEIGAEGRMQANLFADQIRLTTDQALVKRMSQSITDLVQKKGLQSLWRYTLSEKEEVPMVLYEVLKYLFQSRKNILSDYTHPSVLSLQNTLKQLRRESHRMKAFVRFKKASNNIYFATVEPDFDVLPIISGHFQQRYADQPWVIYDLHRNYGLYYDLQSVQTVEVMLPQSDNQSLAQPLLQWHTEEEEFQTLWKKYFHATHIPARKNQKLHLQHVPRRYWKHLVEKQD